MARSRTVITKELEADPPVETAPPITENDEELRSIAARIGTSAAKASINRMNPKNARWEHVRSIEPQLVDEDYIGENFGPGSYLVKFLDEKGVYVTGRRVEIGETNPSKPATVSPAGSLPPAGNPYELQLQMLREDNARQHEMVMALINKNATQSTPGILDLVKAVASIKEIMPDAANPMRDMQSMIQTLMKGIELGQSQSSDPDSKLAWVKVVEHVIEKIPEVAEKLSKGKVGGVQQMDPQVMLKQGLNYLKGRARLGKDPELFVDFVVENIDDVQNQLLVRLVAAPFEEIVKLDPEIGQSPLREWFMKLYEGLRDELRITSDSGGPAGNGDYPKGHGGPGAQESGESDSPD